MNDTLSAATQKPSRFKRALVKLSGEALMGPEDYGIHNDTVERIAREVVDAKNLGVEISLVIGGGNIFRGVSPAAAGMERASADYMGMLATVMNALAMQNALERLGAFTRVLSAIEMTAICEPYIRRRALRHMEKGRIVIFAAGTGNPFFTTDTGAALRAAEMSCDALLKGTQVDGVYSADPKTNPDAERFETLTYHEVLMRDLKVMDQAAISLMRESRIPIVIFPLAEEGGIVGALTGEGPSTIIAD
ncbi:MAG: UMP kinase [Pseudomonadota bacterium]